jgi:hypothetical protein
MKRIPSPLLVGITILLVLAGGCSSSTGFAIINYTPQKLTVSLTTIPQPTLQLYTAPADHIDESEHWTRIDQWYPRDSTLEGEWRWSISLEPGTGLVSTGYTLPRASDSFPVTSLTLRGERGTVYMKGAVTWNVFERASATWYQYVYK